jgi:hypothetical protein
MNKLEEFKTFVKNNPRLIDKVQSSEYSWQQLYETYDIYGESHPLFSNKPKNEKVLKKEPSQDYINKTISLFKNIDMDKISENLQSLKKVIGAIGEITSLNDTKSDTQTSSFPKKNNYKRYND